MNTECKKCGEHYALRDGYEPTPLCDDCAHDEVERLAKLVKRLRNRLKRLEQK